MSLHKVIQLWHFTHPYPLPFGCRDIAYVLIVLIVTLTAPNSIMEGNISLPFYVTTQLFGHCHSDFQDIAPLAVFPLSHSLADINRVTGSLLSTCNDHLQLLNLCQIAAAFWLLVRGLTVYFQQQISQLACNFISKTATAANSLLGQLDTEIKASKYWFYKNWAAIDYLQPRYHIAYEQFPDMCASILQMLSSSHNSWNSSRTSIKSWPPRVAGVIGFLDSFPFWDHWLVFDFNFTLQFLILHELHIAYALYIALNEFTEKGKRVYIIDFCTLYSCMDLFP